MHICFLATTMLRILRVRDFVHVMPRSSTHTLEKAVTTGLPRIATRAANLQRWAQFSSVLHQPRLASITTSSTSPAQPSQTLQPITLRAIFT